MRKSALCTLFILGLMSFSGNCQTPPPGTGPGCTLIGHALDDIGSIRVGMTRGDLEKRFKITHSGAFRNQAVYAYKRCSMIKVRATFSADPNQDASSLSTDKITTMSHLFLSRDPND
jgi:hypothetical protein